MQVKIINKSNQELPAYQTKLSAGMDLRANLIEDEEEDDDITMCIPRWIIKPLGRVLVPTGLFLELPRGYEAQIRPRSGLALKHGITVLNSPGTIDADYRGEVKVLIVNLSNVSFELEHGERIAQMVIASHETVYWLETAELEVTERGAGGFNSTGTK